MAEGSGVIVNKERLLMEDQLSYILEIPENKLSTERLHDLLSEKKATAFVGAGASSELYPLWNVLVNSLIAEAKVRRLAVDSEVWQEEGVRNPQAVVSRIKSVLGLDRYYQALNDTFSPKHGAGGDAHTAVQAGLMRLPFRAFVTTNYDAGLIEARSAERPGLSGTGYTTWDDREKLALWQSREIFEREECPLLYVHGIYQRPETLILGLDDYRKAYGNALFRRVFENLITQEHLVFIGYSFNDPWYGYVSEKVISEIGLSREEIRHVAIIGYPKDCPPTAERRALFRTSHNAEILFYPIHQSTLGIEDHSALLNILNYLAKQHRVSARAAQNRSSHSSTTLKENWVHETTNDERYALRHLPLARLDQYSLDPSVQLIAITGIGGLGKTSLIGYWLKRHGGKHLRKYDRLFFWSFYANPDVISFFQSLLDFGGLIRPGGDAQDKPLYVLATDLVRTQSFLIVLDGLEVLQERPGAETYGTFLNDELRDFLLNACRRKHGGLVVLTSRFPFADLTSFAGRTIRILELGSLEPGEGADLLQRSEVAGTEKQRAQISINFEGHPLALRIFAATLLLHGHTDPTRLITIMFDGSSDAHEPLTYKLHRLLTFYEKLLPIAQKLLLGVVALFRVPIERHIVTKLVQNYSVKINDGPPFTTAVVETSLENLFRGGLLLFDQGATGPLISCHPVLRDHFRNTLLEGDASIAGEAAVALTDRPGGRKPTKAADVIPFVTAIELLLDAGYILRADEIYQGRLRRGQFFLTIPAVHEGRRCTVAFVSTPERRELCNRALSGKSLILYLTAAARFAADAGEPEEAISLFDEAEAIAKRQGATSSRGTILRTKAILMAHIGQLSEAERIASLATEVLKPTLKQDDLAVAYADLGYVTGLQGKRRQSIEAFAASTKWRDLSLDASHIVGGEWYLREAEILLRFRHYKRAGKYISTSSLVSDAYGWKQYTATASLLVARILTERDRKFADALKCASEAEGIFRHGHMLTHLAATLNQQSAILLEQQDLDGAERCAEDSLNIAATRGLRLLHSDALVSRGKALFAKACLRELNAQYLALTALADAETAVRISAESGYAWGEIDANQLTSKCYDQLGKQEKAKSHQLRAKQIEETIFGR